MKWMGVKLLGMGFITYKGSYYLIYACLCRGCAAPSFSMQPFSKPIYCQLGWLIEKFGAFHAKSLIEKMSVPDEMKILPIV
jgi:hypothetical protein